MNENFPVLGIIGEGFMSKHLADAGSRLGINVEILSDQPPFATPKPDVVTYVGSEISHPHLRNLGRSGQTVRPSPEIVSMGDPLAADIHVLVARSPHGQVSTWAPMECLRYGESLWLESSSVDAESSQRFAIAYAQEIGLVGVALVGLHITGHEITFTSFTAGPSIWGSWTSAGSCTNQYEQHVRAVMDLPLGSTRTFSSKVVSGFFSGGVAKNLYRPYLHLMARDPDLKFEQHGGEIAGFRGVVTGHGNNLLDLRLRIEHALDFMNGVIDE